MDTNILAISLTSLLIVYFWSVVWTFNGVLSEKVGLELHDNKLLLLLLLHILLLLLIEIIVITVIKQVPY